MKKFQNHLRSVKLFVMSATVLFLVSNCSTEEELATPEIPVAAVQETASTEGEASVENVASYTITGLYTEVRDNTDCATCTYVVDAKTTLIDGKELGFGPGSVICLDKAVKYQALEFINMEGSAESPIVIAYCGK